jgi:hypothetical protein
VTTRPSTSSILREAYSEVSSLLAVVQIEDVVELKAHAERPLVMVRISTRFFSESTAVTP